jgi:hypothetical protein
MNCYSNTLFATHDRDNWEPFLVCPNEIMANVPILSPREIIKVPCVIPESEIQAFIGELRIRESQVVLARLLIVVLLLSSLCKAALRGSLMKPGCCLLSK